MRPDNKGIFCFGPEPPHVTIEADGPWHARFIYCGMYPHVRPDEVLVEPRIRGAGTYDCVLKVWLPENMSWEQPYGAPALNYKISHVFSNVDEFNEWMRGCGLFRIEHTDTKREPS